MKQFSYSKLGTYEWCPLQYKLRYLTSLKPEIESTVEAFTGGLVYEIYRTVWIYNNERINTALKMPPQKFALLAAVPYNLYNKVGV